MSFSSEDNIRVKLMDCLTQQISEYELLKSMYPNQNDIMLTDNQTIKDIQNFIDHPDSMFTPNHLDFVVNICINNLKLEICVNLPSFYPEEEPDLYVRCNQLKRQEETELNGQLLNYLKENHIGEVCLYTVISWLQENVEKFQNQVIPLPDTVSDEEFVAKNFVRLWIYSHHIYNKKKREEIVKRARELKLNGFCLPGKPGVICIEGPDHHCQKWWRYIKSMTWKRINIRQTEIFDLSEQKENQKFFKFEELHIPNSATSKNNKHADMSGFSKYMEEKGLSKTFNEFFGLFNDS